MQAVDPWLSSRDIDRGSLWFTQISDQLANTSVGIVCLTQENKNNPWILFESGALAKGISSSRVCTFLVDIKPNEIKDPLAQFNHTEPNKESIYQLLRTINFSLGDLSLKEDILDEVFKTYWPQFETKFEKVMKNTPSVTEVEPRAEGDKLDEVLSIMRGVEKRIWKLELNEERRKEQNSVPRFVARDDAGMNSNTRQKAKILVESMKRDGLDRDYAKDTLRGSGFPMRYIVTVINEVYGDSDTSLNE